MGAQNVALARHAPTVPVGRQIDQVKRQNAAMVEESTAATYSLKSKTEELAGKLGQFRITGAKKEQVRRAA